MAGLHMAGSLLACESRWGQPGQVSAWDFLRDTAVGSPRTGPRQFSRVCWLLHYLASGPPTPPMPPNDSSVCSC